MDIIITIGIAFIVFSKDAREGFAFGFIEGMLDTIKKIVK